MKLLPAAEHRSYRWRNGLGSAQEIAVSPTAGDWSLSIATVDADVAFSAFPGMDRHLMALSSGGLGLVVGSRPTHVEQHAIISFAGEEAVASTGVITPTLDLNLMVTRERYVGTLRSISVDGTITIDATTELAVIVALEWTGPTLGTLDAVTFSRGDSVTLTGAGVIALATMDPVRRPRPFSTA